MLLIHVFILERENLNYVGAVLVTYEWLPILKHLCATATATATVSRLCCIILILISFFL